MFAAIPTWWMAQTALRSQGIAQDSSGQLIFKDLEPLELNYPNRNADFIASSLVSQMGEVS
jgi:hypothetical protein